MILVGEEKNRKVIIEVGTVKKNDVIFPEEV